MTIYLGDRASGEPYTVETEEEAALEMEKDSQGLQAELLTKAEYDTRTEQWREMRESYYSDLNHEYNL